MQPLILINDIHADTRTPAGRKDDWWAAIKGKLEQVLAVAVRVNAAGICIAGDLFHAKTRQLGAWPVGTHEVVTFYLGYGARAAAHGIELLFIAGNHDLVFDRLDSLPRQPLGALEASGLYHNVAYTGRRVGEWWVSGVPYPDALDLANYAKVSAPREGTTGVLMAHCFAEKHAGTFFDEPVHAYSDVRVPGYHVYHYGHDHSDHGVSWIHGEHGSLGHVQVGSLGRGSLSGDEVYRKPQFVLVNKDANGQLVASPYALKVAPPEEVFAFDVKARRDAEANVVAEFVAHLDALTINTTDELPTQIRALDLPADIHKRVEDYLDRAQHEAP